MRRLGPLPMSTHFQFPILMTLGHIMMQRPHILRRRPMTPCVYSIAMLRHLHCAGLCPHPMNILNPLQPIRPHKRFDIAVVSNATWILFDLLQQFGICRPIREALFECLACISWLLLHVIIRIVVQPMHCQCTNSFILLPSLQELFQCWWVLATHFEKLIRIEKGDPTYACQATSWRSRYTCRLVE